MREEQTIKEIESQGYKLRHYWYLDELGLKRNGFELSVFKEDGTKVIYPLLGNLRVKNYNRNHSFSGDDVSPYKDSEYLEMLNKYIDKLKTN